MIWSEARRKTAVKINHQVNVERLWKYIPDGGQEHVTNGDDGFLVTATSLDSDNVIEYCGRSCCFPEI